MMRSALDFGAPLTEPGGKVAASRSGHPVERRSLARTVGDFNAAVGSLERAVLPPARRLSELGLSGSLPTPGPVEQVVRPLASPHLVVVDGEASA